MKVLARMTIVYSSGKTTTHSARTLFRLACSVVGAIALSMAPVYGQQNAGLGTATPHPSALLDMTSSTQGLLVPRMTTAQRTAIAAPAHGLLVFDTSDSRFYYYNANTTTWEVLLVGTNSETPVILAPTASTRNTVQPTLNTVTPLTLRGAVGQTATLFSVENSTAATLFSVGNGGDVTWSGALRPSGQAGTSGYLLQSQGIGQPPVWIDPTAIVGTGATWSLFGNAGINPAANFLGTTDNQPLYFRTDNTTRATILANGNIGVGTAAPQTALEISSVGSGLRFTNLTSASSTNATNTGKILSVDANGDVVLVPDLQGSSALPSLASAGMTLRYDGADWVTSSTLTNTGTNVGIGTPVPTRTLDVNGTARIGVNGTTLTNIIRITVSTATITTLTAGEEVALTLTVSGADVGSSVVISPQNALPADLIIAYARVSAANTVEFRVRNTGASSRDLLVMNYYITVIQ